MKTNPLHSSWMQFEQQVGEAGLDQIVPIHLLQGVFFHGAKEALKVIAAASTSEEVDELVREILHFEKLAAEKANTERRRLLALLDAEFKKGGLL